MTRIYLKRELQSMNQEQHRKHVEQFVDWVSEDILKKAANGGTSFVCTDVAYSRYLDQIKKAKNPNLTFVSFDELVEGLRQKFPDSKIEVNTVFMYRTSNEQEQRREIVVNWS